MKYIIILLFPILINAQYGNNAPVKAFPTAYGGGSEMTGFRGKKLAHVTSLTWNAPATYDAVSDTYSGGLLAIHQLADVGYVCFDVSGAINLGVGGTGSGGGLQDVNDKYFAGQTAPLGGITLWGGTYRLNGRFGDNQNLLYRYIRSRPINDIDGNQSNVGGIASDDSYTWGFLFYGGNNIVLDHCSASFGYDKGMGAFLDELVVQQGNSLTDLNFQYNLVADNHTSMFAIVNPNRPDDPQNHMDRITFYNNLTTATHRTPNVGYNGVGEVKNNVTYDASSSLINARYDIQLNHIGNYIIDPEPNPVYNVVQELGLSDFPVIYTAENYNPDLGLTGLAGQDNTISWRDFTDNTQLLPSSYFTATKHVLPTIPNKWPETSAASAYQRLVVDGDVGAYKYIDNDGNVQIYRDPFDTQILDWTIEGLDRTWKQVSQWVLPTTPINTRPPTYDTDNDGMADAWEIAQFGDLSQSYGGDFDGDGYPNWEEFVNQVDGIESATQTKSSLFGF